MALEPTQTPSTTAQRAPWWMPWRRDILSVGQSRVEMLKGAVGVLLILTELVALTLVIFAPDTTFRVVSIGLAIAAAVGLEKWMRTARSFR